MRLDKNKRRTCLGDINSLFRLNSMNDISTIAFADLSDLFKTMLPILGQPYVVMLANIQDKEGDNVRAPIGLSPGT